MIAFPAAALFLMLFALNLLAAALTERATGEAHVGEPEVTPNPAPSAAPAELNLA